MAGIGDKLSQQLAKKNLYTIADLLLALPIRYEDRSQLQKIANWQEGQLVTTKAKLQSITSYYKNRLLITRATINDGQAQAGCFWFNNKFIKANLKLNQEYYFSGKVGKNQTLMQATCELVKAETLHTNRLVPIYSSSLILKQGNLRRILHQLIKTLPAVNAIEPKLQKKDPLLNINCQDLFQHLHFPDNEQQIIDARERLALEELMQLIWHSQQLKKIWQQQTTAYQINPLSEKIPNSIPFTLTGAQKRAIDEMLADLKQSYPMNRLLIGDVGSGKTVVAGTLAHHCLHNQQHVCLIAPTQILAKQHYQSLSKLFPNINLQLISAQQKFSSQQTSQPTLFVGTHALINQLTKIKPALIIYDEQHRFGVLQRSEAKKLVNQPHVLTMTATPIPRSLMLSIFAHLNISYLDELPPGRIKPQTHIVPAHKIQSAYQWLFEQIANEPKNLAIIICPFIDSSDSKLLENVQAVTELYQEIKAQLALFADSKKLIKPAMLHAKINKTEQTELLAQLNQQEINLLVATPIVEVGIDLPQANIMFIHSAERFGLASLHQLRGRVGRAGQTSHCFLFPSSANLPRENQVPNAPKSTAIQPATAQLTTSRSATSRPATAQLTTSRSATAQLTSTQPATNQPTSHQPATQATASQSINSQQRLKLFCQITDGKQLAELDLKNRGAGDIFGCQQHGFSNLRFASWANLALIKKANQLSQLITPANSQWQSAIFSSSAKSNSDTLAN